MLSIHAVVLLFAFPRRPGAIDEGGIMFWNGPWNMPWEAFPWMWIFPLTFLMVLLLVLFRGPGRFICAGRGASNDATSAREILDRRYARGEISREDHQRMRKDVE
ncbi:MAG TPA: SHOCT domain-containing protein [Burkholderiales bacterium]|nr:SHOCT domain-containing protein [Burkholderiales bacterium]